MNVDISGMPVQANGDANDQLQRASMIVAAEAILNERPLRRDHYYWACLKGITETLQVAPGVYKRHSHGEANNVSADQLVSVTAAHVAEGNTKQVLLLAARCLMRLGFAQNYKDGLSGQERTKIPDFMGLRALPLFARAHSALYPVALVSDLLLVLLACAACAPVWRDDKGFTKRGPDDCDDNVTVLTLAVCRHRMPTPLSWLASKIYGKLRPYNFGCAENARADRYNDFYHPVFGALRWYHRKESGGNPEIAEMWAPICERYFE